MEQSMGLENSIGKMVPVTMVSSSKIISVDKANTGGATDGVTTAPGRTIRCMAKANLLGPMDATTSATTLRT